MSCWRHFFALNHVSFSPWSGSLRQTGRVLTLFDPSTANIMITRGNRDYFICFPCRASHLTQSILMKKKWRAVLESDWLQDVVYLYTTFLYRGSLLLLHFCLFIKHTGHIFSIFLQVTSNTVWGVWSGSSSTYTTITHGFPDVISEHRFWSLYRND